MCEANTVDSAQYRRNVAHIRFMWIYLIITHMYLKTTNVIGFCRVYEVVFMAKRRSR